MKAENSTDTATLGSGSDLESDTTTPTFDPVRHITRSAAAKRVYRTTQTLKKWEGTKGLRAIRINARLFVYDRLEFELVAQEVVPLQLIAPSCE